MSQPVNLLAATCLLFSWSESEAERERLAVCVRSGPGPQEQRAYRAQWGQPHQGSPQTAGSLRWCIGLGILIGPSVSARGPGVSVCVHPCVLVSVFVFGYTALCLYLLSARICLCVVHICILGGAFKMCTGARVCGSCTPCLFECTPHTALWAAMYFHWPFICCRICTEQTHTHKSTEDTWCFF